MTHHALPCIACGKELHSGAPESWAADIPDGAIAFQARGNYGSAIFDLPASSREALVIYVCDDCIVKAGRQGQVYLARYQPAPPPEKKYWTLESWAGDAHETPA